VTDDPIGTAIRGVVAGAATGAATLTIGVFLIRSLQGSDAALAPERGAAVLGASILLALAAAAASAWLHTRYIADMWRRGVAAALGAIGAVLAGIPAMVADIVAGRTGVGAYAVMLVAAAIWAHREAARTAGR
jgi:hypothetical protein